MSPPQGRKKRPWLRRILVLLVLLCGLGVALNGPIARWFVAKTIREKLAEQGLSGDLTVEGQLITGFTLRDGQFSGSGEIELIKFKELGVSYWILDLRQKKIESVVGRQIVVVTNPTPSTEPKKERDSPLPDLRAIGDTLREIRPLFLPVRLELSEVDFTQKRPGQDPLRVTLGSLTHESGASEIVVREIETNALGTEGLRRQDLVLKWEDEQIALSRTHLVPELAIDFLQIALPVGDKVSLHTMVDALATGVEVHADDKGNVSLTLKEKVLDLSRLTYFPDLELAGQIEQLEVEVENLLEPPGKWRGHARVRGTGLRWPKGALSAVMAECELGNRISLKASVGEDLQVEASVPRPEGDSLDVKEWMEGLIVALEVKAPSLHAALQQIMPAAGSDVPDLKSIPGGAIQLSGHATLGGPRAVRAANLSWSFSEITYREDHVPNLVGTATLNGDETGATIDLASPRPDEALTLKASFDLKTQNYTGTLDAKLPDPAWILPLIPNQDPLWKPQGALALNWNGSGSLSKEARHRGALNVEKLTLTAPQESLTEIALAMSYNWPEQIEVTSLSLRNGDLWLEGKTTWENETVSITDLRFHDQSGPVATINGNAPLAFDRLTRDKYLAQEAPLNLHLEGNELKLERLGKLLPTPMPEGFKATLGYNLTLAGTPASPTLDGKVSALNVRVPSEQELPLLSTTLTFATEAQRLSVTGAITEPSGKILDLNASIPLELKASVENPEHFQQLKITANAHLKEFALSRLVLFAPALKDADGHLDADLHVAGTVGKPVFTGNATTTLKHYPLPDSTPYGKVYDSKLVVHFEDNRLVVDPATQIHCAGGKLTITGSVGLENLKEPQFALTLVGESLLAWRNDSFILRNHARLNLTGPLNAARITGEIQFIESLFYKDIDLIPISVPTENVPKPQLPHIDQAKAAKIGGIPAPFGDWALEVTVRTAEPVLIRGGNFASGQVTALARVNGTLSSPRPSGTITIQDAWARLPLAGKLNVRRGILTLRPDDPYNPVLDLRGAATIDRYNISLNVFGNTNSPQFNLFSDPPLPESEILTLLATGTTTGNLEKLDQDAATMKAVQFATTWFKDKFQKPGRDTLFQRFLTEVDQVELNVGENDPFSGRKFNSATLELTDNLLLSAAVDATGNTRGVVIFSVRFR